MSPLIPRAGISAVRRKHIVISQHLLFNRYEWSGTTFRYHRDCGSCREQSSYADNIHQKILLPQHGQNGTLMLRSNSKSIGQVDIIPQWRDDTLLELMPIVMPEDSRNVSATDMNNENCIVKEVQYNTDLTSTEEKQTVSHSGLRFTLHRDGISTALRRKGSFVEVDVDIDADNDLTSLSRNWKLVATVPEKFNITCSIAKGDISVNSKLEGDAHLTTSGGNIQVSKLRGHNVTLDNSGASGYRGLIYVKKGIEAQTVRIKSSNRVRARMVNGSDVSVQVSGQNGEQAMNDTVIGDEDDAGFKIDIGSLYISGSSECEARLNVDEVDSSDGLVRVKSSHGHVMVHAKTKQNTTLAESMSRIIPSIDLGGVNGSCEVSIEVGCKGRTANVVSPTPQEASVTTRVHFDSLSPGSISTISSSHFGEGSDEAVVSVTVDRKVEADLRLLTVDNGGEEAIPIDIDRLTSDELDDVESALRGVEEYNQHNSNIDTRTSEEAILIQTKAFDEQESENMESECFHYKQGTIRNKSGEPDSRFDVRASPSRGKINIDSAASQALSGFQGKKNDSENTSDGNTHIPLLAVATNGKIKLETLSWLGAIARRYGLEGEQELGRRATRRPRLK